MKRQRRVSRRSARAWAAVLAAAMLLAGCGSQNPGTAENPGQDTEATEQGSSFQPRVGSKVPDAFLEKEEDEVNAKAKGFTYDEENMDYRLVWSDEFDEDGLPDESKWSYELGANGWGNHELQNYTDHNAEIRDGKLVIELRKDAETGEYTSARMVTKGKGSWKYGKIEVCAKLPAGLGTWPAIWMMPEKDTYGSWPKSGEIDICEHVGYDQGVIHSTIHTGAYNHTKNTQKYNTKWLGSCSEEFHVYGLEWLPDKLIVSVDGEPYFTYKPTDYVVNPTEQEWPYDQEMFLILNIAFGGDWGGARGIDETLESASMEVDYVRVYQSPQVSYMEREDRVAEDPFLKADGKVLRDGKGTGELVQLKGTNVGGYLLQEFWMTVTNYATGVNAEDDVYRVLTERFGEEKVMELVTLYQDNYFTESDFDYCKELGMNCLRLPIWYRNLVDENGEFYEDCWDRIDWFTEQAAQRNMYVILDMHGAPGSQNGSDHSGHDGGDHKMEASEFFFGDEETVKANQELYYKIWEAMADHYKDNPWVAGYDLLNEPYCTYRYNTGLGDAVLHKLVWDVYDEAYRRIRAIDPDHVIIMEATWDPVDLPDPALYGWENVMYEYHNYLYDDYDNAAGNQVTNMQKKLNAIRTANYNVPSYLGEFALFNNLDAWDEGVKAINESGVSWTTWTYKVISEYGNWGVRNQKDWKVNLLTYDYDAIANAWSQVGDSEANTGLAQVLTPYYKMIDLEAR